MEETLNDLIVHSEYLHPSDKEYLMASIPQLDMLERLKLQQNLNAHNQPFLLRQLEDIKAKYRAIQNQPKPGSDPLSKLVERFIPKKEKKPLSFSILSKPNVLGSNTPVAVNSSVNPPTTVSEISDPSQLRFLTPEMIDSFGNEGFEQKFNDFFQQLSNLFNRIDSLDLRRNYFLTYMKSTLFSSYISTGLTAMKHEELKPRKISLNLLYQIDQKYLNSRQFKTAAKLTNHLRILCAL